MLTTVLSFALTDERNNQPSHLDWNGQSASWAGRFDAE